MGEASRFPLKRSGCDQLVDVRAGNEGLFTRAGQDQPAIRRVVFDGAESIVEFRHRGVVQSVKLLRPVHGQEHNAVRGWLKTDMRTRHWIWSQFSAACHTKTMNVAVLGMGYVGSFSAACLPDLGHTVTGADRDEHKIRSVLDGRAPFYEPGLEEIVNRNVAAGRLSATTSTPDAIQNADVALICVGTPSEKSGNLGLDQLRRVVADIAE